MERKIPGPDIRGGGEYLSAYSYLSGCPETASQKLIKALRRNFTQVFGEQLEYRTRGPGMT
ncbi:MAG TPA: hypothetical protein DCY86_00165 [Bdellovibrionales bacterium]|nr:hypothetical protein [Bdellovibrionales bacterium]